MRYRSKIIGLFTYFRTGICKLLKNRIFPINIFSLLNTMIDPKSKSSCCFNKITISKQ